MNLAHPIYQDADKAREHLEAIRWPNGPVCPHCGVMDRGSAIKGGRKGLYFCNACRMQYSVTVGTVYERSKIPLNKWLLATHLIVASKTAISAHQLHRMLGITYKSSWFMCHRIREAMTDENPSPMGGEGQQVQADETFIGGTSKRAKSYRKSRIHKDQVLALVDPQTGRSRAKRVKVASTFNVQDFLFTNADRASTLVTDESKLYHAPGADYAAHEKINHSHGKYVNKKGFTTNHVENFFGVFKRGRKITDTERAVEALKGIEGKRLTYRRTDQLR